MKKVIYLLNIGDYAPEITAITYPWIERYAEKIGAEIYQITERRFPEWDLDYEKLQIYRLGKELGADWNLYLDSDALVHPELPDLTAVVPFDTVAHNGADFGPIRWRYDAAGYFQRDGRHIGSCNWLAVASSWCIDLWRPLDDMTPADAVAHITPTPEESRRPTPAHEKKVQEPKGVRTVQIPAEEKAVVTAAHLVSDFALSRNIARFGLKFTTLSALWRHLRPDFTPDFFFHEYTTTPTAKAANLRATLKRWRLA